MTLCSVRCASLKSTRVSLGSDSEYYALPYICGCELEERETAYLYRLVSTGKCLLLDSELKDLSLREELCAVNVPMSIIIYTGVDM